jgi:hypothetical protein
MAGHIIVRAVAVVFGLLIAYVAAGSFLAAGLWLGYFRDLFGSLDLTQHEVDMLTIVVVAILGLLQAFSLAAVALAPSLIAVILAESFSWRGLVANLLLGGGVGLTTGWLVLRDSSPAPLSQGAALVLLAAGFTGGFFYWLIAGRRAGSWRV